MSPPTRKRLVTASLEPEDVAYLESLPGTLSQNIRQAVSHGCAGLRGESLAPEHLAELRQICERMEATLRKTPTGCWYAASPAAMPEPDALEPWDCVTMPHGLLVVAPSGALSIDTAESRLVLQGAGHGPVEMVVEPRDLLHLASHYTAAILEQCEQPGRCELPMGLALVRDQNDLIRLELPTGHSIALPLTLALAVGAELSSLAVRAVDVTCARREQLEAALAEVGQ
jgi:hypothetical protein